MAGNACITVCLLRIYFVFCEILERRKLHGVTLQHIDRGSWGRGGGHFIEVIQKESGKIQPAKKTIWERQNGQGHLHTYVTGELPEVAI